MVYRSSDSFGSGSDSDSGSSVAVVVESVVVSEFLRSYLLFMTKAKVIKHIGSKFKRR